MRTQVHPSQSPAAFGSFHTRRTKDGNYSFHSRPIGEPGVAAPCAPARRMRGSRSHRRGPRSRMRGSHSHRRGPRSRMRGSRSRTCASPCRMRQSPVAASRPGAPDRLRNRILISADRLPARLRPGGPGTRAPAMMCGAGAPGRELDRPRGVPTLQRRVDRCLEVGMHALPSPPPTKGV